MNSACQRRAPRVCWCRFAMQHAYDAIYLSPHFDDAVLSCGGQMASRIRQGGAVLVVTLAAGAPPDGEGSALAQALAGSCDRQSLWAERRAEDRRACACLGADGLHVPVPDAVERRHPDHGGWLYASHARLLDRPDPDDPAGAAWLDALRRLPAAGRVFSPLAVGGHADHRLCRQAAEAVFGRRLEYYEDWPYANRLGAVWRVVWPRWRWRRRTIRLAAADREARWAAVAEYATQLPVLDGRDADRLRVRLERYTRRVGGERIWRYRSSSSGAGETVHGSGS